MNSKVAAFSEALDRQWRESVAFLGSTIARSRPLILSYTLESAAAINLFTDLDVKQMSHHNLGILLSAVYFMLGAVFAWGAEATVSRLEHKDKTVAQLRKELSEEADAFGYPLIGFLSFTILAIVPIIVLNFL